MMATMRTYLALGDSMSIDDYTGVEGGGAARQFFGKLGEGWSLDDRTLDGARMEHVATDATGDVITLTIGGNDLLWNRDVYLAEGPASFAAEHLDLLRSLRRANPTAVLIVGDIYHPNAQLTEVERAAFDVVNRIIQANCLAVHARHAPIFETFRGHEAEYLCFQIEPTLRGAEAIAGLFWDAYQAATQDDVTRI